MILPRKIFEKIDGRSIELVCSINSNAVTATLVYFEAGSNPKVISEIHREVRASKGLSNDQLFDHVLSLLKKTLEESIQESQSMFQIEDLLQDHQQIQKIQVILGAPFNKVDLHNFDLKTDINQAISKEVIEEGMVRAIPQGHARLDTVVTSTHANGYLAEVQSLVGMNAQEVNISFLEIYGRFDYMETIFQLINGLYNIEKENINFFSAESAIQKELQTNFKPRGSYAVLQILGTHSTVALYSKDILVGYTTAEFGWNTMQDNAIENGFALNVEAYESMVRTYTRGHLDEEHSQQMSELIENESREIDQVIEQLSFENQITKPKDMYVQSDRQIVKALIKNNNDSGSTRAILLQPNVSNVDRIDDENTPLLSSNVMIVKYLQDKLQDNIVV